MFKSGTIFNQRRERTRLWLGAAAIFFTFIVLAVLGTPHVTSIQPSPGSSMVPSTARIHITFNQPMDRVSVETRLTIEPPLQGTYSWEGNALSFQPDSHWPEGKVVEIHLAAGARSNYFLPILRSNRWSFTVGVPRIVYLTDDDSPSDLYVWSLEEGEATRLTESAFGVLDFSVAPDGTMIAYTALLENGSSEIRVIDLATEEDVLIYACPSSLRCQKPALSPQAEMIIFEQTELVAGAGGKWLHGEPQIMGIQLVDGTQALQLGVDDHNSSDPYWSPDGLLAYYDATTMEIVVIEPRKGADPVQLDAVPNELGNIGAWSPDSESLAFADLIILDAISEEDENSGDAFPLFYSHIFRLSLSAGLISDLSGSEFGLVEDSTPVYSPDGECIAFTRKFLEGERWTLGRQLWIMRSDGAEAKQLTDDPDYNHLALAWSPDSSLLSFVRTSKIDLTQAPEIWIVDVETNEMKFLLFGGVMPQWIP
jgi:TolB protein